MVCGGGPWKVPWYGAGDVVCCAADGATACFRMSRKRTIIMYMPAAAGPWFERNFYFLLFCILALSSFILFFSIFLPSYCHKKLLFHGCVTSLLCVFCIVSRVLLGTGACLTKQEGDGRQGSRVPHRLLVVGRMWLCYSYDELLWLPGVLFFR